MTKTNKTIEDIENYQFKALCSLDGAVIANDDIARAYHKGEIAGIANMIDILMRDNEFIDILQDILDKQDNLQKHVGTVYDVPFVKDMTLALMVELGEFLHEIPVKNWSKKHMTMREEGKKFINEENAKEELIDCLHFIMNIFNYCGMSAKDIHDAYIAKWTVNHERQNSGY